MVFRRSHPLHERPFVEELRAVERLLPVPPQEINQRVLASHLGETDLDTAERLNAMNLRYYETVVRPILSEWHREVRARRLGQGLAFAASCGALVTGCFVDGTAASVLVFTGSFGFCTAIAAWFGGGATSAGGGFAARLASRVEARTKERR